MRFNWAFATILMLSAWIPAKTAEPLAASGCSISMTGYLNEMVKVYEHETGQKILLRGGGSYVGLAELGSERVDFAASCKTPGPDDPRNLRYIPVAWDALVFIVNPANPVSSLTPQQVQDIYEGRLTGWKALGGPDLPIKSFISTPVGMAGIGESLTKYILAGKHPQATANSSRQSASVALWEQMVEKTPEGFASTGFDSAQKRHVKMLAVNGVLPTKAAIISGRYPYKRQLWLVTTVDAKPEVNAFIKFALSAKGQELIAANGVPPLAAIR